MTYNGDIIFFESDTKQDDEVRADLAASQLDQMQTYEALKLLHIVSRPRVKTPVNLSVPVENDLW